MTRLEVHAQNLIARYHDPTGDFLLDQTNNCRAWKRYGQPDVGSFINPYAGNRRTAQRSLTMGTILGGGKGTGGHSSPALVWLQVDEQRVLAKEGQKTHRMT